MAFAEAAVLLAFAFARLLLLLGSALASADAELAPSPAVSVGTGTLESDVDGLAVAAATDSAGDAAVVDCEADTPARSLAVDRDLSAATSPIASRPSATIAAPMTSFRRGEFCPNPVIAPVAAVEGMPENSLLAVTPVRVT